MLLRRCNGAVNPKSVAQGIPVTDLIAPGMVAVWLFDVSAAVILAGTALIGAQCIVIVPPAASDNTLRRLGYQQDDQAVSGSSSCRAGVLQVPTCR